MKIKQFSDAQSFREGSKADTKKRRYDLVPSSLERQLAEVMTYGAQKYRDLNWTKGLKYHRLYAAIRRHLDAWWTGEDTDPESGLSHLAHIAANCAMLLSFSDSNLHQSLDDRKEYAR